MYICTIMYILSHTAWLAIFIRILAIMATKRSVNEVFQDYYQALMFSLPMTNAKFLDDLYKHISIHENFKSNLESLTARKERTSYFLDHIMKPQISVDDNTSFVKLLNVMKKCNYDNVKDLAEQIEAECTVDIKCKFILILHI